MVVMELTSAGCKWLMRDDDRRDIVNRLINSQKKTGWPVEQITAKLKCHWSSVAELVSTS